MPNRFIKVILCICSFFLIFENFEAQNKNNVNVSGFSISKNDKTILLACDKGDICSIYLMNSDSFKARQIIAGAKKLSYFNPSYSQNEKQIVFVGYFDGNINNSALFIANSDGSGIKQLTTGNEIIKEAIFSRFDSATILFTKASFFGANSPIGTAQAKGMDIFSYNLNTGKIQNITEINASGVYDVSEADSENLIFTTPGDRKGGMHIFNKLSKDNAIVVPANNPRGEANMYYSLRYSHENDIFGFTAPFELYLMSSSTKIATRLYRPNPISRHIDDFCFYHEQRKVIFQVHSEGGLNTINFDGTNLRKIEIELDK